MALPPPAPDRTAIVTGASSGIGVELARQLARRGHGVTLVARRRAELESLATELAATLGIGIEEARAAIDGLWAAGVPGWVHPGTDLIASFPPFNLQPTQYRISIDGKPGWYGQ